MRICRHLSRARRLTVLAVLLVALLCPAPGARAQVLLDRVLAVVSGTVITLSDARAAVAFGLVDVRGARDPIAVALRWLIEQRLALDEAARYEPIDPDMASVEGALVAARLRYPSGEAWSGALASLGLTEESARTLLGEVVFVESFLDRRFDAQAVPTEDDLREYYDRERARFVREGRLRSFDEVRADIEPFVRQERRARSMAEWMARLRRRAEVSELYVPAR